MNGPFTASVPFTPSEGRRPESKGALLIALLCACGGERKQPPADPPPVAMPAHDAGAALAPAPEPRWLVDLTPLVPRPELAAHAPVVVGDRVIIAGSRVDYRALDLATGAEAWHRPGGASLSPPAVVADREVVLVHDCAVAVAAPPGRAVLACFDWIDPLAIAARKAGSLHVAEGELGGCTSSGGVWQLVSSNPGSLGIVRGSCLFDADLRTGAATRLPDPPPPPEPADDVVAELDGRRWYQVIDRGKSYVTDRAGAPSLPGLTVLAAAARGPRGAVVVRADSSLVRDYLAAYDGAGLGWRWPLPAPPDPAGRGGPVGVAVTDQDVFVFFDAGRVARFTAPWAGATAD